MPMITTVLIEPAISFMLGFSMFANDFFRHFSPLAGYGFAGNTLLLREFMAERDFEFACLVFIQALRHATVLLRCP